MKMHFTMIGVRDPHVVTIENDSSFYLCVQRAALLALKDAGVFTQMQYRQAEEALLRQLRRADHD